VQEQPEYAVDGPALRHPPLARALWGGLGWLSVGLALAGMFLPGLPTTVFVLAASWCFARSSPRFQRWLWGHAWLGRPLRKFAGAGGMPRSGKRLAIASMWTAVAISALLLAGSYPAGALVALSLAVVGTLAILFAVPTVPER
jgi:uncharacterized membrane protein YbaN (DUF454 family)